MTATDSAGPLSVGEPDVDDPSGPLAAYLARMQTPLDVTTAQVASRFVDQSVRARSASPPPPPAHGEVTLAELAVRLARIEALLAARPSDSS